MNETGSSLVLTTSWGEIIVDGDGACIQRCVLPEAGDCIRDPLQVGAVRYAAAPAQRPFWRRVEAVLRALLEGLPADLPPVTPPPPGSPFVRAIGRVLREIPRGCTVTYGELARQAGYPGAARAAGRACGMNPVPLFVPCHRVVAAGGRMGGFSGGRAWKQHLLTAEARTCG